MKKNLRSQLLELIHAVIEEVGAGPVDFPLYLDRPKEKKFGDWSLNCAFKLAQSMRKPPVAVAEQLAAALRKKLTDHGMDSLICRVDVKAPGFINLFLSNHALYRILETVQADRDDYGRTDSGNGERVLLEFVSANPTGPLSIAHARQAAVGDALANILAFAGYRVEREYYINDEGNQIRNLGLSLQARYEQEKGKPAELPADGYQGAYLKDMARQLIAAEQAGTLKIDPENALDFFMQEATEKILAIIRQELLDFGVEFDHWLSQKEIMTPERVRTTLNDLRQAGFVFEEDGATWFRSTAFGDDKDRVLIKSDGSFTYVSPDIAYHQHKFQRGYTKLIDIFGPDHHGYISRLKASVSALGHDAGQLSVVIIQLATLFRDGKPVVMSTRAGEYISLRELLDEVGRDVARFHFLMRRCDSLLEFDLELAKTQSMDNPVYYVQYAYARICSIEKTWRERGYPDAESADLTGLQSEEELDLIRGMSLFSDVIDQCARQLEPQGITQYLRELAKLFHLFYDKHRVLDYEQNPDISAARFRLLQCAQRVLKIGLRLCGVRVLEERM